VLPLNIERSDPTLLHDQLAAEVRRVIADGSIKPGEHLPPVRDFAAVLGINKNTVLRAFRILRDEGLLEFRRGYGITVAGSPQRGAVIARVKELLSFAREQGYRPEELIQLIRNISVERGS
jgi:GntR family transcriptional regulator